MSYQSMRLAHADGILRVTLNRPEIRNSLNPTLLRELQAALDIAESLDHCRLIVIEGVNGVFSAGMDLDKAAEHGAWQNGNAERGAKDFLALLQRLRSIGRIVVANVDGDVVGGGVGLASASDFVLATGRSQFSLPEALWGLMPCCVLPFLIRRVGFQKACTMALSTQPVSAGEAERFHLVDKVTDDANHEIRKLLFRASRLSGSIIGDLKRYLREIAPDPPGLDEIASREFSRLLMSDTVQQRLASFAAHQRFPWEN